MMNPAQPSLLEMKLTVSGIDQIKGNLMIAVFEEGSDFPNDEHAIQRLVIPVSSKTQYIEIRDLKPGKAYAIAMYHDQNANGKLDKNLFGIPTERYGFSNNARGTFGPPSWSEAKFVFQTGKRHLITVK
jgi:uncharacterized protein (DUF2141 family)